VAALLATFPNQKTPLINTPQRLLFALMTLSMLSTEAHLTPPQLQLVSNIVLEIAASNIVIFHHLTRTARISDILKDEMVATKPQLEMFSPPFYQTLPIVPIASVAFAKCHVIYAKENQGQQLRSQTASGSNMTLIRPLFRLTATAV